MADYELIGLNEAVPDLRAPTSSDRGILAGGLRIAGLVELDGGADINGDPVATVSRTNPLRRAVRVAMTAASSGSNGIQVLDNDNLDMGTNNFTLHWEGALPDYTPSSDQVLRQKHDGTNGYILSIRTTGHIRLRLNGFTYDSTVAITTVVADGDVVEIDVPITRETESAAGQVLFMVNGVQLGDAVVIAAHGSLDNIITNGTFDTDTAWTKGSGWSIAAGVATHAPGSGGDLQQPQTVVGGQLYKVTLTVSGRTTASCYPRFLGGTVVDGSLISGNGTYVRYLVGASGNNAFSVRAEATWDGSVDNITVEKVASIDNTAPEYIMGTSAARTAGVCTQALTYNRALTAAEVLSLSINGPALADIWASQTALTSGTLVVGLRYRIDTYVAGDSFTNVGAASNASGVEFVATGTTPTTWTNSSSLRRIGITGQWNAEDAQSNTGQIFDSSGNGNHALLPAAGATVIGRPQSAPRRVEWANTWAGTSELQYIGGVNQAILETRTGWIVMDIFNTGSSVTVDVGDGVDQDRFVAAAVLATGPNRVTFASPFTDGTNRKLTIKPSASFTGTLITSATYQLVRAS